MTADNYINSIVKKIKCSRKTRTEIKKQLQSDIYAAIESGETLSEIQRRMGSVAEVAAEFNANISEEECKKYKKIHTLKIIAVTAVAIVAVLAAFVWWWLPKTYEFGTSGIYDEATVKAQTERVIQLFNEKDYEALRALSAEVLRPVMKEEDIEPLKKLFGDDWGAFKSFGSIFMVEMKQQGQKGVVAQMSTLYENVGVTFTVTFNEEMELIGFYFR